MSSSYHHADFSAPQDAQQGSWIAESPFNHSPQLVLLTPSQASPAIGPGAAIGHRLSGLLINRDEVDGLRGRAAAQAKRLVDIVGAALLLVVTLPLMLAAAVAVALTSRGPVLYRQERVGLGGNVFEIIKFRSMVTDADELVGEMAKLADIGVLETTGAPAFKSAHDPRVTPVGRFLRRTGIDELPQLLNVLEGAMSLVGPRPLVPTEAAALHSAVHDRRHSVRPGITCLWQVLRESDTSFDDRIDLDVLYATRWSMRLDLQLLMMTPRAVMGGSGSF